MIELRSDTFTSPSPGMREAMAGAPVGDDVFGEDPSINALQERCAAMLNKEAALFVPSGTMGNQIALNASTRPGDEILLEASSHIFLYEAGAPAMLSGIQARPIRAPDGILTADLLAEGVRARNDHFPRTSLIALENTHNSAGGTPYPVETPREIRRFADEHGLVVHLDGARMFNALVAGAADSSSAALETGAREMAGFFDSVTFCFSKGLGAPVGSMLCGTADFISEARRVRKKLGGGMRQAGILAAACAYALDHNLEKLALDHEHAAVIARAIAESPRFEIGMVPTNIVRFRDKQGDAPGVQARFLERGIKLLALDRENLRGVTHLDVSRADAEKTAAIIREEFRED